MVPSRKSHPVRHRQAPSWASPAQAAPHPPPRQSRPAGRDEALTRTAMEWCRNAGLPGLAATITVVWNSRLQTTAGTACPGNTTIELNPVLQAFGPAQVQRTLKHEAAHLIAHHRAGRRRIQTHGREWRQACAELGIPDEPAFHELPLPRRQVNRKYAYRCRACGLTVQRVRPFSPHTACYQCCKKHSGGRFHADYLFQRVPLPPAAAPEPA